MNKLSFASIIFLAILERHLWQNLSVSKEILRLTVNAAFPCPNLVARLLMTFSHLTKKEIMCVLKSRFRRIMIIKCKCVTAIINLSSNLNLQVDPDTQSKMELQQKYLHFRIRLVMLGNFLTCDSVSLR